MTGEEKVETDKNDNEVVKIADWNFVSDRSNWHLIGFDQKNDSPRLSTPVVKIEFDTNTITTISGRKYQPINGPGKLDPRAETFLKNLSGFNDFKYTIEFKHVFSDENNQKKPVVKLPSRIAPFVEYKNNLTALLEQEFRDISPQQFHFAWVEDQCFFIGTGEDELHLWNKFSLRHQSYEDVQRIFTQQAVTKYSATQKASKLIQNGELSRTAFDPTIPIVFTKECWDEVCQLFSEMMTHVIADNSFEDINKLALQGPNERGQISWIVNESLIRHKSKWLSDLSKSFDSKDYINEILNHHYQAVDKFNLLHGLNANV